MNKKIVLTIFGIIAIFSIGLYLNNALRLFILTPIKAVYLPGNRLRNPVDLKIYKSVNTYLIEYPSKELKLKSAYYLEVSKKDKNIFLPNLSCYKLGNYIFWHTSQVYKESTDIDFMQVWNEKPVKKWDNDALVFLTPYSISGPLSGITKIFWETK
jgi:hypothetical protein